MRLIGKFWALQRSDSTQGIKDKKNIKGPGMLRYILCQLHEKKDVPRTWIFTMIVNILYCLKEPRKLLPDNGTVTLRLHK